MIRWMTIEESTEEFMNDPEFWPAFMEAREAIWYWLAETAQ